MDTHGSVACHASALIDFNVVTGSSALAQNSLDGGTVADQLGTSQYNGFIGHVGMIPVDQSLLSSLPPGTVGVTEITDSGAFQNNLALIGFCIDSETGLGSSTTQADIFTYEAYNVVGAEARYLAENVPFYLSGGLLRAAYMLENFIDDSLNAGDQGASALQAAIWSVLYDNDPDLTLNQGNYFIRTNFGNSAQQTNAEAIRDLGNNWLTQAAADNWGGASYNPSDEITFWLSPDQISDNQAVITFNRIPITPIPEPSYLVYSTLFIISSTLLIRSRRSNPR